MSAIIVRSYCQLDLFEYLVGSGGMSTAFVSVGEGGGGGGCSGECNRVFLGIEKMIFPHSLCNLLRMLPYGSFSQERFEEAQIGLSRSE